MLCFEGISLMLSIFLGKRTSPNYRLVSPPNGELQVINVDKEVSMTIPRDWAVVELTNETDRQDTSICCWSSSKEHQIYQSELRLFHSSAR